MNMLQAVLSNGGATYQPYSGVTPDVGLAVSIYPQASQALSAKTLTGEDIQTYIQSHDQLLQDHDNYVGLWHDLNTGLVYLDISKIVLQHKTAFDLCVLHGQRAYYDIGAGQEVCVLSEELAHVA